MKIKTLKMLIEAIDNCEINDFEHVVKNIEFSQNLINKILETCIWNDNFYTRNLLKKSKNYEAIFLCWKPQQISSIHDHANQKCWVNILQGTCEEKMYKIKDDKKLSLTKTSIVKNGQFAYIDDTIALHSLQNVGSDPMISLHIYSNPIDTCLVYDFESGATKTIQTKYSKELSQEEIKNMLFL